MPKWCNFAKSGHPDGNRPPMNVAYDEVMNISLIFLIKVDS